MENYAGEIRMFAGNYAPDGWHLCDGSMLSVSEYQLLFAIIATTYGGDGVSNFALPDLRGRLPVGQGKGPGLTQRAMGQSFGAETVTVTQAGMPEHSHQMMGSSDAASSPAPGGVVLAASAASIPLYDVKTNPKAFDNRAVSSAGGDQPHPNTMPSSCVNFIIATSGLFPPKT